MKDIDVLVIVAADGEDDAFMKVSSGAEGGWSLLESKDLPSGYDLNIHKRRFKAVDDSTFTVALTRASAQRGEAAAAAASRLVSHWRPTWLVMTGVCAGRHPQTRLGDVIVADRVYRFSAKRETAELSHDGWVRIDQTDLVTYNLHHRVKQHAQGLVPEYARWSEQRPIELATQGDWLLYELGCGNDPTNARSRESNCPDWDKVLTNLWDRQLLDHNTLDLSDSGRHYAAGLKLRYLDGWPDPPTPKVHVGPLGTGDALVARPGIWNELALHMGTVVGLDMESSAIGTVAELQDVPRALIVKGVMDYADPERAYGFRDFAALAAAEVALQIIRAEFPHSSRGEKDDETSGGTLRISREVFAHTYALQRNFTGRSKERALLSGWWRHPSESLLVYKGIGGEGKSSLSWVWLVQDVLGKDLGVSGGHTETALTAGERPEGVLWYSFYEPKANFDNFLHEALGLISKDPPAAAKDPVAALIKGLRSGRYLLVLDGFETELRGFGVHQAADSDGDSSAFRECADSRATALLTNIASLPMRSRILLNTRLSPSCVDELAKCRIEELEMLTKPDAIAFLERQGVRGVSMEMERLCTTYGTHALTLRLLAGVIANHPLRPGDAKVALDVIPEPKRRDHHVLEWAFNSLSGKAQVLLGHLAAFRITIEEKALGAISPFRSHEETVQALAGLFDRGLLMHDRERLHIGLHPVVRSYAYARLRDKKGAALRLIDYYTSFDPPDDIKTVGDLEPTMELFHQLVDGDRVIDALTLFENRVWSPLVLKMGEVSRGADLLKRTVDHPDATHTARKRLGSCLVYLGDDVAAVSLFRRLRRRHAGSSKL